MIRYASVLGVLSLIFQVQPALAESAQFHGRSLEQWFKSYFVWYLNGSSPRNYRIGDVRFLPLPEPLPIPVDPNNPYPGVTLTGGVLNISLREKQYLLLPLSAWTGELYKDGTKDDPSILTANDVFGGTTLKITVDGKPFYSGTAQQFNSYHFGPFYFDKPIPYQQPTSYGATAAVWEEGTGLIYPPLPKGRHTINVVAVTPVFGFGRSDTWNITVKGEHQEHEED